MTRPVVTFCLALSATCALIACESSSEPVDSGYESPGADKIIISGEHTLTSDGIRSAIVYFDTLYMYDDSAKMHLRGMRIELFAKDGHPTGIVTADRGVYDERTQLMVGQGDTRLVTIEGDRIIETEEMFYDPNTRQLWSDSLTYMETGGSAYEGDSFRADDAFNNVTVSPLRSVARRGGI